MGNINGRFADQVDIITTGLTLIADNNTTAANAALAETDQLRGSAVIFQPTGLLATVTNDVPNVAAAVSGDIGAALSGQGQQGTPSEGGGGQPPCFIGLTRISTPHGDVAIDKIDLGETVWSFDPETGERVPQRVIAKWAHLVPSYTLVEFADGRSTGLIEDHKYWTNPGYTSIRDLDTVWHWSHNAWIKCAIEARHTITGDTIVYNLSVEGHHNYIANGDAVSNLKPIE